MNITHGFTKIRQIPWIYIDFDRPEDAIDFKKKLTPTGLAGNINKKRPSAFKTSGLLAVAAFNRLGVELPESVKNWTPQKRVNWNFVTDEEIIAHARQFQYRTDWRKACSKACSKKDHTNYYQLVMAHRKHLKDKCFAHMERPVNPNCQYQVYTYEWNDNTAYVGLTCRPKSRHEQHKMKGPVFEKQGDPVLTILADGLKPDQAIEIESAKIKAYVDSGWTVLNKDGGGSLGQVRMKYTFDDIKSMVSQATSLQDFIAKFYGPFQVAERRGWVVNLVEIGMKEHGWPRPLYGRWSTTEDDVIKELEILRPKSVAEWRKKSSKTHGAAIRLRIFDKLIVQFGIETWKVLDKSYESCLKAALTCCGINEFTRKFSTLREAVNSNGWVEKLKKDAQWIDLRKYSAKGGYAKCMAEAANCT